MCWREPSEAVTSGNATLSASPQAVLRGHAATSSNDLSCFCSSCPVSAVLFLGWFVQEKWDKARALTRVNHAQGHTVHREMSQGESKSYHLHCSWLEKEKSPLRIQNSRPALVRVQGLISKTFEVQGDLGRGLGLGRPSCRQTWLCGGKHPAHSRGSLDTADGAWSHSGKFFKPTTQGEHSAKSAGLKQRVEPARHRLEIPDAATGPEHEHRRGKWRGRRGHLACAR